MNRNSNSYTIVYAAVMVILVAVGLAFTSQALKSKQRKNEDIDKMQQILRSIRIVADAKDAPELFRQHVREAFLVDFSGDKVPGSDGTKTKDPAFETDFSKSIHEKEHGKFPVYVADVDGKKKYVLGMSGSGLWGHIWGYISLDDDKSTIFGIDFSHESETPGLGAQITEDWFKRRFRGKSIFDAQGTFQPVRVMKHAEKAKNAVDAISGSTLTSNGVNGMIGHSMKMYEQYLKRKNDK